MLARRMTMGGMGSGNAGAGKGTAAVGLWKPDYGGRGAKLDQVQTYNEFKKTWKAEDKENRRRSSVACKWCEMGECWDHGQIGKPAKENGDSEVPAKRHKVDVVLHPNGC